MLISTICSSFLRKRDGGYAASLRVGNIYICIYIYNYKLLGYLISRGGSVLPGLAGWLASQQKVPPSPGLIIISIIIIVMIVKLFIISSISTINFIHICNMNDINNIYALTLMVPPL